MQSRSCILQSMICGQLNQQREQILKKIQIFNLCHRVIRGSAQSSVFVVVVVNSVFFQCTEEFRVKNKRLTICHNRRCQILWQVLADIVTVISNSCLYHFVLLHNDPSELKEFCSISCFFLKWMGCFCGLSHSAVTRLYGIFSFVSLGLCSMINPFFESVFHLKVVWATHIL